MIANLPLLFANGNPTSLSNISASELERFITFMVTCSWGHDTARHISRPPWWPDNVPFSHPFVRPRAAPADWSARLKALVKRCYDFHKSAFLLVFSAQLARYPRARLRYVDNNDHTTSLYYRPSGRLLVTFRNENMHYDRLAGPGPAPRAPAIYLCDYCDSHFDNVATLRAHERLCNATPPPACAGAGGLSEFLAALRLQPRGAPHAAAPPPKDADSKVRNGRGSSALDRGLPYPFSSLAYMKSAKPSAQRDLSHSRERAERYCCTSVPLTKLLAARARGPHFPARYRRPIDYWVRRHTFPDQRGKRVLSLAAQLLLLRCRPVSVRVERLPARELTRRRWHISPAPASPAPSPVTAPLLVPAPMLAPVPAPAEEDPLREEVIDLCSDDEGAACVVRGGAVLRRAGPALAAAGERAAAPGGAVLRRAGGPRRALLPPTPLLLIAAHPLSPVTSLQTISID